MWHSIWRTIVLDWIASFSSCEKRFCISTATRGWSVQSDGSSNSTRYFDRSAGFNFVYLPFWWIQIWLLFLWELQSRTMSNKWVVKSPRWPRTKRWEGGEGGEGKEGGRELSIYNIIRTFEKPCTFPSHFAQEAGPCGHALLQLLCRTLKNASQDMFYRKSVRFLLLSRSAGWRLERQILMKNQSKAWTQD